MKWSGSARVSTGWAADAESQGKGALPFWKKQAIILPQLYCKLSCLAVLWWISVKWINSPSRPPHSYKNTTASISELDEDKQREQAYTLLNLGSHLWWIKVTAKLSSLTSWFKIGLTSPGLWSWFLPCSFFSGSWMPPSHGHCSQGCP